MAGSSPVKVPPSPAGIGTAVAASVCGVVLLGATAAIALGMPQSHGDTPGTALAVVGASVVWGALQAPLTIRWTRRMRLEVWIQRQLASYKQTDPARFHSESKRIRAEAGVSEWEVEWWLAIIPGVVIATVAAFLLQDGASNWPGTRTWAAVALPALWTIGSTLRHLLMDRIAEAQAANEKNSSFIPFTVLFGFPLMLILPSTALLFLTASGAVRFIVTGIEAYSSRQDPAKELRAALVEIDPSAVERRAAAVAKFLAEAPRQLVQRDPGVALEELERIAVQRPGRVMRLLAQTPHLATAEAVTAVVRSWARGTEATEFDDAWEALETLCGAGPPTHERLLAALAGTAPDQLPAEFRRKAALRIFTDIDAGANADPYLHPDAPAWTLLAILAPDGAPRNPGDWWCALADAAADRGDIDEARRRYQAAIGNGCEAAKPRLAYHLACTGHRALTGGDPSTAAGLLTEAVRLDNALDYRLLLLLAQQAHGSVPDAAAADSITTTEALEPWPGEAWSTAAMVRLLRGDASGSARLLRGAERRLRDTHPEAAATARLIAAVLTGDVGQIAAEARGLVDQYGSGWTERIPFDPATVLSRVVDDPAVLSTDPSLAGDLLKDLDAAEGEEVAAIRAVMAHRLLGEAALAADEHRFNDAQERMSAAMPLLDKAAQPRPQTRQPTGRG